MDIQALTRWFARHHRALPWRDPSCSAWGVMVSEVMLQQTPVARVEPVWHEWMARWPTPGDLARSPRAEAIIAWGRLGYPRRALRLHQAATLITQSHGGDVPTDLDDLLALPGIGDYTARAIRTFAYGIPEPVVDTNVRRVVARAEAGQAEAGPPRVRADREAVWDLIAEESTSTRVQAAAALMELGALICTARSPKCAECPVADSCRWRLAEYPEYQGVKAPTQARFEGSDRHVRGIILRELRSSDIPIPEEFFSSLWKDSSQLERALESLVQDGLATRVEGTIGLAS